MNIRFPWRHALHRETGKPLLAGVELGGTKVICTLGTGPNEIVASARIPTQGPETTLSAIEQMLDEWMRDHPGIAAIGIASFGPLDLDPASPAYGALTQTSKPGWSGVDVLQRIRLRYGLPIGFDTDVNGAALAEGRWGGAQGLRSWVYITIGTGVGAGVVMDHRTVRGLGHAEAGHMLVRRAAGDAFPGTCPFHGDCVEGLIAGPAVAARAKLGGEEIADDHPVWASVSETIAAMIHNLAMTCAPQRIFLGGGVIEKRPHLLVAIRRALVETMANYAHASAIEQQVDSFIVPPALGDMAGPLGALALAFDAAAGVSGPLEEVAS